MINIPAEFRNVPLVYEPPMVNRMVKSKRPDDFGVIFFPAISEELHLTTDEQLAIFLDFTSTIPEALAAAGLQVVKVSTNLKYFMPQERFECDFCIFHSQKTPLSDEKAEQVNRILLDFWRKVIKHFTSAPEPEFPSLDSRSTNGKRLSKED